jgi:hypothetical protein
MRRRWRPDKRLKKATALKNMSAIAMRALPVPLPLREGIGEGYIKRELTGIGIQKDVDASSSSFPFCLSSFTHPSPIPSLKGRGTSRASLNAELVSVAL